MYLLESRSYFGRSYLDRSCSGRSYSGRSYLATWLAALLLLSYMLIFWTGCQNALPVKSVMEELSGENSCCQEEQLEEKRRIEEKWNSREIELVAGPEEQVVRADELGILYYFEEGDTVPVEDDSFLPRVDYCAQSIKSKISQLFPETLVQPQEAQLVFQGEPLVKEHQNGKKLSTERAARTVINNIWEDRIQLPVEVLEPEVTTEDIEGKGIKEKLSSYSTSFDPRVQGRTKNIQLTSESVDHTILEPGETFSYNQAAGPYTSDRGFQKAPVFRRGTIITGLGGGVCQVSSTLYNGALLAGMEIVERHPHSLPVWYVPLSRDAAVSYGRGDLKIKNSSQHHIYIRMEFDGEKGEVKTTLWGTKEKEVQVVSEIEKRISPPVEEKEVEGLEEKVVKEEGQDGYRAAAWRIIDGNWELLSRDYYQPLARVIEVPLEKEEEEKEDKKEDEEKEDKKEEKEKEEEELDPEDKDSEEGPEEDMEGDPEEGPDEDVEEGPEEDLEEAGDPDTDGPEEELEENGPEEEITAPVDEPISKVETEGPVQKFLL